MRRLFTDDQIAWAAAHPPEETRAWLRGTLVSEYSHLLVGASWDQVLLRAEPDAPLVRIPLAEPRAAARVEAEPVLRAAEDDAGLIDGLERLVGGP